MPRYCYRGYEGLIASAEGRLSDAGFSREGEVEAADVVITYFTSMTQLEEAYFGDDGLAEVLGPQNTVIDLSSTTPNLAMELSGVCAVSGIAMVSAPLLVKDKTLESAFVRENMACFAGGEEDAVDRARDMLDVLFGDVRLVADAASAQLMRAANTIQSTADMVAAIEVLSLFRACSKSVVPLDVKSLIPDAISSDALFVARAVRDESYQGEYTVEMLMSELSAAMMCADDYDLIMPQTEAAFHLYELLAIIGGSDMSPAALSLVYEGDKNEGKDDAHGLDWARAERLYGHDVAEDAIDDLEADEFDFDDDDDFSSGFGYSIN